MKLRLFYKLKLYVDSMSLNTQHRIQRSSCTAVIIDIQERLLPHIDEHDRMLANVTRLIAGFQAMNIPMVVTEQYTKGLGMTVPVIRTELDEAYQPLEKMSFSCLDDEAIAARLNNGHTLIIAGIEAHVCVQQTVLDALDQGRNVVVVEDCISSRDERDRDTAIARMRQAGAIITSYEAILFELCRVSGTPEFKTISSIVK